MLYRSRAAPAAPRLAHPLAKDSVDRPVCKAIQSTARLPPPPLERKECSQARGMRPCQHNRRSPRTSDDGSGLTGKAYKNRMRVLLARVTLAGCLVTGYSGGGTTTSGSGATLR